MIISRLNYSSSIASIFVLLGWPTAVLASEGGAAQVDLTNSVTGFLALGIFVFAYALVMAEEFTHLRKSKPVILAAGIIWVLAAASYPGNDPRVVTEALRHNIPRAPMKLCSQTPLD